MIATGKIYNEDCRLTMNRMDSKSIDIIITDPVWPNCGVPLVGRDDPYGLFESVAAQWPRLTRSAIVHLGVDSDPRILSGVPDDLPFLRVAWLRYVRPKFKGRILWGNDVAYLFGEPRVPDGNFLIPGECSANSMKVATKYKHPCPRKFEHVEWLIKSCTKEGDVVYDPFCGSGTVPAACEKHGRRWIASEIDEAFCTESLRRIRDVRRQMRLEFKMEGAAA